jgi:hypothetical protein
MGIRAFELVAAMTLAFGLAGCSAVLPSQGVVTPGSDDVTGSAAEQAPAQLQVGRCPWATPRTSSNAPTADQATDPVAATEAIALDEDDFWKVIESIPDLPTDADFRSISSKLAGCSFDDIVAFDARLTIALYALDSPKAADWYAANDPSGLGLVADDDFLYFRCEAVLAGYDTWQRDAAQQILDWRPDSPDLTGVSEDLLYVGLDAARAQGVADDDYFNRLFERVPISYETGSNPTYWH